MSQKILVADVPELDGRLIEVLTGHQLYFVRTVDEAMRTLGHDDFHLLVISVHFDDSRMFDLLRQVRSDGRNRSIPIVCVREPGLGFTAVSARTLEVACRALDANMFVDLAALKTEEERSTALRGAFAPLLRNG